MAIDLMIECLGQHSGNTRGRKIDQSRGFFAKAFAAAGGMNLAGVENDDIAWCAAYFFPIASVVTWCPGADCDLIVLVHVAMKIQRFTRMRFVQIIPMAPTADSRLLVIAWCRFVSMSERHAGPPVYLCSAVSLAEISAL
jgi:hypothetical protein